MTLPAPCARPMERAGGTVSVELSDGALRQRLAAAGLRVTPIRVAVYRVLAGAAGPVSHRDAVEALPELDRVSVFRNLVALVDAGLARRLEVGDHTWRFELSAERGVDDSHTHAHFTCTTCGEVTCLDDIDVAPRPGADPVVARLLTGAEVQLRGTCEECR